MNSLVLLSLLISSAYGQDWSVYWTQDGPGPSICSVDGQLPPPGFGNPKYGNGYLIRDGYELAFSPPLLISETYSPQLTDVLYEPNTTYTITLRNEDSSKQIGGFFVGLSSSAASNPGTGIVTGSDFSNPSAGAQVLGFSCYRGSRGIGHTNGNVLWTSVSATWTAPASGAFTFTMTVKEDTDMQNGKWISHSYSFWDQYAACADYAGRTSNFGDDHICQAPAILDENARCSMVGDCPANVNFGNASTNCCKLPPAPPAPAPAPDTSKPVTPSSPSDDSSDTQNSASTIGLSMVAVALSILLASMI